MPRIPGMAPEQKRLLNVDKRVVKHKRYEAESHVYAINETERTWQCRTEAGKKAVETHKTWSNSVTACRETLRSNEMHLLAAAVNGAREAAFYQTRLEFMERTGKTELVTPVGNSWDYVKKPDLREPIEEIRAKAIETKCKAIEAKEAACTLERRKVEAKAELERLQTSEPSTAPIDDGTEEYKEWFATIEKGRLMKEELERMEKEVAEKRTRFRESNVPTSGAKRGKTTATESDDDEDDE